MDATSPKRHAFVQRKNDLYETPLVAVRALLRCEYFGDKDKAHIWEPACGRGAIAEPLRDAGYVVRASDLVDYGCPYSSRADFLSEMTGHGCSAIVTNPPFKLADEFVRHALSLCPKVVMLLRLAFLESEGRSDILDGGRLARVHVFKNRLPMMHRDGWKGPRATSTTAYAWFVWDRKIGSSTTINRIAWEKDDAAS